MIVKLPPMGQRCQIRDDVTVDHIHQHVQLQDENTSAGWLMMVLRSMIVIENQDSELISSSLLKWSEGRITKFQCTGRLKIKIKIISF